MVKEIQKNKTIYFECEDCKLLYKEKAWAMKCQEWCSKNKSCNIGITKHAINKIKERE